MINWKTILSSFDDKPTLMQWLKIVEKALQNASLESVTAKAAPNNAVAFEFKFADGSTVTSTATNIEVKGLSGIEEVSDEIVGNQTLTTLRAHYTDGTMDEFPVYAENGNKLYVHNLTLSDASGGTIKVRVISKLATAMSFEYLYDNFSNFIFVPRIMGSDNTTNLLIQFSRAIETHTIIVRGWKLEQNTIIDYTLLSKVNSDTVSELK